MNITFLFQRNDKSSEALYMQLYNYIKEQITHGRIKPGERLPALRKTAKELSLSLTTIELAYNQLLVEGYIISKPQSGYYVTDISSGEAYISSSSSLDFTLHNYTLEESPYIYDTSCFDFAKWRKTTSKVLSTYSHLLLFAGDSQGEAALRYEISKYVYSSRGVICHPSQVVIGAGTQQLMSHLGRILNKIGIQNLSTETPGYLPAQRIFADSGFTVTKIPVDKEGIKVDLLPTNIPSAVYVNPNNQFPTGAVMSISRRYQLLNWAKDNKSYILEDDYDSELRYFGKPVPALQGLAENSKVVYLGSFSSTLFPAIRVSYMVLPEEMTEIFKTMKQDYAQTCSKTEQLTLAFFMDEGHYTAGIKKMRNLYRQKLSLCIDLIKTHGENFIKTFNTNSGLNLVLSVDSHLSPQVLCNRAKEIGAYVVPVKELSEAETIFDDEQLSYEKEDKEDVKLLFYYSRIPLQDLEAVVKKLIKTWKQ